MFDYLVDLIGCCVHRCGTNHYNVDEEKGTGLTIPTFIYFACGFYLLVQWPLEKILNRPLFYSLFLEVEKERERIC